MDYNYDQIRRQVYDALKFGALLAVLAACVAALAYLFEITG
jgi:hypothetical protein